MKFVLKSFFSIMLLLSAVNLTAGCNTLCEDTCAPITACKTECPNQCGEAFGKTFFSYRPQDSNVARRMVGVIDKTHLYDKEELYGVASLGLQYTQTFENHDLARFLSFNDNTSMTYGPTCGAFDVYGLNFGTTGTNGAAFASADLSPAAASTTTGGGVCIKPRIKNFIADIDLFTGLDKFVCGLWARINLPVVRTTWNLEINEAKTGTAATGNFPINSVTCADGTTAPVKFANLTQAWQNLGAFGNAPAGQYGKLCGKRHETKLAGLHFEIGYDFWRSENGFLGLGAHFVAPTGTTPNARLFFEPVAGANHSWQLGATVQAGYRLWENCDGNQSLAVYLDSVVTHLFGARQKRLFGLNINGASSPGSSFLLLKRFNADGSAIAADGCLERAENLLAIESKIKADIMADLALMLQYEKCNFSSGVGYNFWLRTKEKISGNFCNPFSNGTNLYAIKGSTLANNTNTQSTATIGACGVTDATPVFLKPENVDPCLALNSRTFSNKIFGFIGHTWKEREWMPFLLLEGEVEFGNNNKAVDQWGVMLKGGVSF